MAELLTGVIGLIGGGGAAAGGAAAAAAPAAATGFSLSSILQGTATVLGVVASLGAGAAEADQLNAQAVDAEAEKDIENLQGIQRRSSIKRELADALGAQDVAYAASGVDLSFGTAAQARKDAYREADTALNIDAGTQQSRVSRLGERARNYRRAGKQARLMGAITGITGGLKGASSLLERN